MEKTSFMQFWPIVPSFCTFGKQQKTPIFRRADPLTINSANWTGKRGVPQDDTPCWLASLFLLISGFTHMDYLRVRGVSSSYYPVRSNESYFLCKNSLGILALWYINFPAKNVYSTAIQNLQAPSSPALPPLSHVISQKEWESKK